MHINVTLWLRLSQLSSMCPVDETFERKRIAFMSFKEFVLNGHCRVMGQTTQRPPISVFIYIDVSTVVSCLRWHEGLIVVSSEQTQKRVGFVLGFFKY